MQLDKAKELRNRAPLRLQQAGIPISSGTLSQMESHLLLFLHCIACCSVCVPNWREQIPWCNNYAK